MMINLFSYSIRLLELQRFRKMKKAASRVTLNIGSVFSVAIENYKNYIIIIPPWEQGGATGARDFHVQGAGPPLKR